MGRERIEENLEKRLSEVLEKRTPSYRVAYLRLFRAAPPDHKPFLLECAEKGLSDEEALVEISLRDAANNRGWNRLQ